MFQEAQKWDFVLFVCLMMEDKWKKVRSNKKELFWIAEALLERSMYNVFFCFVYVNIWILPEGASDNVNKRLFGELILASGLGYCEHETSYKDKQEQEKCVRGVSEHNIIADTEQLIVHTQQQHQIYIMGNIVRRQRQKLLSFLGKCFEKVCFRTEITMMAEWEDGEGARKRGVNACVLPPSERYEIEKEKAKQKWNFHSHSPCVNFWSRESHVSWKIYQSKWA